MSSDVTGSRQAAVVEDPILEVRDATVSFDMERGSSRVLDSVDIDIERGEILSVVGESGSGKSMFASSLLDAVVDPGVLTGEVTYHRATSETVDVLSLSDEELKQLRWEDISMVFQGAMSSFNPTMKIRDHFVETLKAHDADVETGMERARQMLSDLYLEPDRVMSSYQHELSGGMKQRALIALSLVLEPDVLVMDEPTAALDLLMQRSIISLLEEIKETYDLTLVFITHDLELAAELADRIAVMYAFEFAEVGSANDIILDANHPYTRALINSTPNLETPVEAMKPIEGESPDPVDVPEGCSYHPRCPLADDLCRGEDPTLAQTERGRRVACHHFDRVDDEIPLSVQEYELSDESLEQTDESRSETNRAAAETVMELDDVKVHFEDSSGGVLQSFWSEPDVVQAVNGVDLEIKENDVVALVGESGCGKTTLGKTLIGRQRPTDGSIEYRGQDIWDAKDYRGDIKIPFKAIRRSLQIIHQDPGSSLNPTKTVKASLSRPLKHWHSGLTSEEREARIFGMLERVGMSPPEDYADRYPHQLSGGEKQRVALIRALLMNPDLIFADEAVSALDVSLRVDMMDLLLDLQEQFDTSYLFISHNLSNARYLAEKADGRIGIMYLGELVEFGTVDEIIHNPQHPYTQALVWATPDLDPESSKADEPPIRDIDIPDPVNPPSACRFHTRCPVAREICTRETPELHGRDAARTHETACFRAHEDDHPYWDSEPITDQRESGEPPKVSVDDEAVGD